MSSSIPPAYFYVYTLARPDARVFYVGKGSGNRIAQHEKEAHSNCMCHKCNIIRKVWRQGGQIQQAIVFQTHDESEAYRKERELIAFYGRESLANKTDGGEGVSGYIWEGEALENMRRAARKRRNDPNLRIKISIAVRAAQAQRPPQVKKIPAAKGQGNPPKLTPGDVRAIRAGYADGLTFKVMAVQYRVSATTIRLVAKRKRYKNIF